MPTVLRIGSYRFFFYAGDRDEPPHIHVESEYKAAKFWLNPVRMERSGGFNRQEINQILKIVLEYKDFFERKWNEFFND